ncbi:MAG: DUF4105 domain-containing protein [Rickettsiales bacterium]|nr:DUF4105 domain-containing protein [Rickettsiales bacterium]
MNSAFAELWETIEWKSLLHNGIIKDNNFYLSKTHKIDDELIATIDSFQKKPETICKFPARYRFLVKNGYLFEKPKCLELEEHIRKISAVSISIAFATENITSPMSMMGHVIIKISGKEKDFAVSYMAVHTRKNFFSTLKFFADSLFYGSSGFYTLKPYSEVIELYNDTQDRNIEEYKLDLSQEQVDTFIEHLWELKGIEEPYNFIFNNCGTASIETLSVSDKRLYDFYHFMYTPIDTLKKLYSIDLISDISLYYSDSYKIKLYQDNFTFTEKKEIKNFIKNEDITKLNDAQIYMAGIYSNNLFINEEINLNKYKDVQTLIENNFNPNEDLILTKPNKITINNPFSSAISGGYGKYKNDDVFILTFRPTYRDINDDSSQVFTDFTLNLLKFDAYYNFNKEKFKFKEIDFYKIKSLSPTNYLIKTWSFAFTWGVKENDNENLSIVFDFGLGKTIQFGNFKPYFLAHVEYFKDLRLLYELGIIFNFTKFDKTIIKYIDKKYSVSESIFLSDKVSLNFEYEREVYKKRENYKSYVKIYF